ncbi:MAG: efflux transporter outer membrane subunit, partial [Bdellovibrionales bacterium]|nr:efflux transporter outer membrane subunit [Bdellovibrionales bacterium]
LLWWRSFEDAQLTNLIEKGVATNYSVAQAVSRINQSRALANVAFSELLPGALLNGSYVKAEESGSRFPGGGPFTYEVYSASVDASWELDIFGRLRRELEARNAVYDGQIADLHDVVRMVITEIAMTYIDLRGAQSQLKISQNNKALQADSLKLVQTKFKFGEVSELDVVRAKNQLAGVEASIPPLAAAVKTHLHRLAVLVGMEPTSLYEELAKPQGIPVFKGPMSIGTPKELLRDRPDIRVAERQLAASTARIGVATGELFPKLQVRGSLGMDAPKFSDLSTNRTFNSFGPSISWAAFDLGRLRYEIRRADKAAEEALLHYEETLLKAFEDVENSFVNYTSEQQRTEQLTIAEDSARRAYRIANDQYKEGALDFLSVLDTQRTLLESESQSIDGAKRRAQALVGIYKALGGGWHGWELSAGTSPEA